MPTTQVILVRHAEKEAGEDPPLTAAGREQATFLGEIIGHIDHPLAAAFTSTYRRTIETAEVAIAASGTSVTPVQQGDPAAVAQAIKDRPRRDEIILVVHHTDTLGEIARGLRPSSSPPAIADTDFEQLWCIALGDREGERYGKYPRIALSATTGAVLTRSKRVELDLPWPIPAPATAEAEREALEEALAAAVKQLREKYDIGADRGATGNMLAMVFPSSYQGCETASFTAEDIIRAMKSNDMIRFHEADARRVQPYNVVWVHKAYSIRELESGTIYVVEIWKDENDHADRRGRVLPLEVWAPYRGTKGADGDDAKDVDTRVEQIVSRWFARHYPKGYYQGFRKEFADAGGNLENITFGDSLRMSCLGRSGVTEAEWSRAKDELRDDVRRAPGLPSRWQAALLSVRPGATYTN